MQTASSEVEELTRKLVAIESTTGCEGPAADFLYGYLRDHGWSAQKLPVEEGRWNVFARRGAPQVVFSTHIDTVPPHVELAEDEAFIYGRGACDAKGIAAAQVSAAEKLFREEGIENICLLFVVGEERNSAGAIAANRWVEKQPFFGGLRYLINGEPTENVLASGTKGSLRCRLTASGVSAHSAYPHLGVNAIEKLLEALHRIRSLQLRTDPDLGEETLNLGTIQGGTRPNVVPDFATAEVMFRLVDGGGVLKNEILQRVGGLAEVNFEFEVPPLRLKRMAEFQTAPMAYTTDIPFLTHFGEPLLLGPGCIDDAHTLQEKISKQELSRGVQLYADLARALLRQ
ncbi:MAG TPA: M20/M25/M40 family metallo-hydrolase [Acidobacteriota bacterium]|jgi:acetylornithine deacetylase